MNNFIYVFIFSYLFTSCISNNENLSITSNGIRCTEVSCQGEYIGPEFINRSDIAHQFSNTMSQSVGDHLKLLYDHNKFSKVNFKNIQMSTQGMGTGKVRYSLVIPFLRVKNKCDAYTSFDHVGGWNHSPELERRKIELSKLLLKGEELNISPLIKTAEGLEEYWIQWKNNKKQAKCSEQ